MNSQMSLDQFKTQCAGTQFLRELRDPNDPDPRGMNRGYYNLILSIRDCKLYEFGLRPHRDFRLGDVKKYFGISGKAPELTRKLEELRDFLYTDEEIPYRR